MALDDEAARKARARSLREQIRQVTKPTDQPKPISDDHRPASPKSPRDLIHDKMRELDRDSK